MRFATLVVLLIATASSTQAAPAIIGRAVVADGDTFTVGRARIRLWGVDAPELHQSCTLPNGSPWACGVQAREALKRLLAGQIIYCDPQYQDRNGRPVSKCSLASKDLAGQLVASGWALDFPRYSRGAYQSEERAARSRRAGVWRGSVTPPWEWRVHQKKAVASPKKATAEPPDPACRIKGNIGVSGQRIAHVPGQRDYEAVRIDIARGERWFCTLTEARTAGWRPAAR